MRRSILQIATLLLLTSCGAGWHRVEVAPATSIPPRQQVLVFHGGATERWIDCDSCHTSLPVAVVDSIRVGDPAAGFVKSYFFTVYAVLPATLLVLCVVTKGCPSGD